MEAPRSRVGDDMRPDSMFEEQIYILKDCMAYYGGAPSHEILRVGKNLLFSLLDLLHSKSGLEPV